MNERNKFRSDPAPDWKLNCRLNLGVHGDRLRKVGVRSYSIEVRQITENNCEVIYGNHVNLFDDKKAIKPENSAK